MKALVTGSTGYIGSRLVQALLDAGHEVFAAARSPEKLSEFRWADAAIAVELDVLDADSCRDAMQDADIDVAYYLVHGIGEGDFASSDHDAAETFGRAARETGVSRVVYLGGFVPNEKLSEHLESRAEVAEMLRDNGPELVWLRAAMVLGAGSTSFELVRHLVNRLPVVPTPEFMQNDVQPIAVNDALHYLVAAGDIDALPAGGYDIAGTEEVRYQDIVRAYASAAGLDRMLVPAGFVPPAVASRVISRLVPLPGALTEDLVRSLRNTMVSEDLRIRELVADPPGGLTTVTKAMSRALVAGNGNDPLQLWDTDPRWSGDRRRVPGVRQLPALIVRKLRRG